MYKHIKQDLVYLTFKSACLVTDGIKLPAVFNQIVPFPWDPAVSFPIKIKYDSRSHACKPKLHFPPCVHFGETHCLQPAVCAHHSTRLRGVWCTLVASISTACIPLPSFHKAITFSPLPHFLLHCMCTILTVSFQLCFIKKKIISTVLSFAVWLYNIVSFIYLPLWIYNKQLRGDLIPCEGQLRSYQDLFDIIRCKHVRITLRSEALHWALCSTWILISETINLIMDRYMSVLPAPWWRTVSPLKLERVAEVSQALSPGSQTVWKQVSHPNLFADQLPNPQNPGLATLSRLCKK